jgi:hypothetical protein
MEYAELRHVDDIKFGGFGSYGGLKYQCSPVSSFGETPQVMIISNMKELVEE